MCVCVCVCVCACAFSHVQVYLAFSREGTCLYHMEISMIAL